MYVCIYIVDSYIIMSSQVKACRFKFVSSLYIFNYKGCPQFCSNS